MKKILAFCLVLSVLFFSAATLAEEKKPETVCKSKYKFSSECTACHIPPTGEIGYPLPSDIRIYGDSAYIYIENMDFQHFIAKLQLLKQYPDKKIVFDLFSFGGSAFDAMAMVALVEEQIREGKIIEIRARGLIASAGLLVLLSGSPGYRSIEKNALIMFHEISGFKFFAIERPSDKEEEAAIFRKIQDKINSYIVDRSKISLDELSEKIKKKEFWLDAQEAVKYGFADKIIN